MVRLTRIYTRGGDAGETSLGDGTRVPKHALRVAAYGTVDEANAAIGIARLHADTAADEDAEQGAEARHPRHEGARRIARVEAQPPDCRPRRLYSLIVR